MIVNSVCPLCEQDVESMQYVKHCTMPDVVSVVYIHATEKHFVFVEPRDEGGFSLSRTLELSTI